MKKINYHLIFKIYNYYLLNSNILTILFEIKKKFNFFKIKKIIKLKSEINKISINRSPFVDNVSKEQFETRTYKVLIILEITSFSDNKNLNIIFDKLFEKYLINILKFQEITISLKKNIKIL